MAMYFVNCRVPAVGCTDRVSVEKVETTTAKDAARIACERKRWATCSVARSGDFRTNGRYRLVLFTARGKWMGEE